MSDVRLCPHCNGQVTVTPDLFGIDVTCPHCQQVFSIPGVPPQQTFAGAQQYQQPGYGLPPGAGQRPVHVPDYLVFSILATLLCCLPCGIVAIVYAAGANSKKNAGNYHGALKDARTAKSWLTASVILGVVYVFIVLGIFIAGASR